MDNPGQGEHVMENDFFASRLLAKLDQTEPVFAAYEAQAESRTVGFDFSDFQDVVPRALDEIRETKEAFEEEGPEGHEHFGDEIADIMFSLVNLARHAGLTDLPGVDASMNGAEPRKDDPVDTIALVDDIGARISATAATEGQEGFLDSVKELLKTGMEDTVLLAWANGFDPKVLLTENVRKYLVRCEAIETLAKQDGKQWSDLSANNEIIAYWKKAKALLK
jgi:uncharacterized protein YabN with tetrapyrrole methylase and pyrophosphatase domain